MILEDVRDPGNLGTAVRTAEAFDVPLVMTEGCAELYNPKTIRSTMGSVFRAKLCRAPAETIFDALDRRGTPRYAAALSPQAQDVRQAQLKGAESLNAGVAAALLMWEMRRSR